MDQLTKIVSRIVDIANASEDKTILGVRLGAALKATFPSFSPAVYQCKNLRQFIKRHVSALAERPYTGDDVLYSVVSPSVPAVPESDPDPQVPPSEPDVTPIPGLPVAGLAWKAFSNPGYPLAVIANTMTGEIKTVGSREAFQPPWVSIPKLTSEELHKLAEEFVSKLPEPPHSALSTVLQQTRWYVNFFHTAQRLGQGVTWSKYKRERLISAFTAALRKAGISSLPPTTEDGIAHRFTTHRAPDRRQLQTDDVQLRELVSRLASTLPIDELRSIRIPIGLVLDALKR